MIAVVLCTLAPLARAADLEIRLNKDIIYDIASDSQNRKYLELRSQVKRLNPSLSHFDVAHEGDSITVTFGFRNGPDRAELRLIGSKHDFYRMAMGVRLAETLQALTRADPMVESLGVETQGKEVILKLRYAGEFPAPTAQKAPPPAQPEAQPKPQPPASKPAEAPATPAEAEVEVKIQAVAPPAPARPVAETAAPPPAAPSPPAEPSPADEAAEAWDAARQEDTLQAYVRFLERYPDSPQADEARARADELRENLAYRQALRRDTEEVYRAFLDHFPESSHRAEIEARIQAIEARRRQLTAERKAQEAEKRRRAKAYAEARKLDTAEAYRIFLAAYPDAPEAAEARKRLRRIEEDDRAFAQARGDERRLEEYLGRFPKGRHREEARREARELRRRRMEADYQRAVDQGTEEALAAFLKAWPRSPHESKVRKLLARLRAPPAPPEPAASEPVAPNEAGVLRAAWVSRLPAVDGNPSDPVWAQAPELEVDVAPSGRTLRVRAVHDGERIALLVRWEDPTRDALYRPWVWDPARNAYHQNEQADDGLAVAIYGDPQIHDPCMLQGRDLEADMWVWRAFWSDLSGYASDGRLQISRTRMPRSNPYPSRDGSGQLWIREEPDVGAYPWSFFVPVEFQGSVVPSYKPSRAAGSRADVTAKAVWAEGVWSVEMERRLRTGNADDVELVPGKAYPLAFAVYDRSEKDRHSTSGVVRLEIEARR